MRAHARKTQRHGTGGLPPPLPPCANRGAAAPLSPLPMLTRRMLSRWWVAPSSGDGLRPRPLPRVPRFCGAPPSLAAAGGRPRVRPWAGGCAPLPRCGLRPLPPAPPCRSPSRPLLGGARGFAPTGSPWRAPPCPVARSPLWRRACPRGALPLAGRCGGLDGLSSRALPRPARAAPSPWRGAFAPRSRASLRSRGFFGLPPAPATLVTCSLTLRAADSARLI